MPNRVVRESILRCDKMNTLSWQCECFFRRLMSVVDDYGRFDGRATIVRSAIFPLKLDSVSETDIGKWMNECSERGLVSQYSVNQKPYLEIVDFRQTVRIKKEKYPPMLSTCIADDKQMLSTCLADDKQMLSTCMSETKPNQSNPKPIQSETNLYPNAELKIKINLTEVFFNDLQNGKQLERLASVRKVEKVLLLPYLERFRKHNYPEYKDYNAFVFHFQNWLNQNYKTEINNNTVFRMGKRA